MSALDIDALLAVPTARSVAPEVLHMVMRVAVRDLRNDTRRVMDAVERGEEVVLTRRGRPIARIVPMFEHETDIDAWLAEVTAEPASSGMLEDLRTLRREDDEADVRRERDW
jgi:prevent-host-death family protein